MTIPSDIPEALRTFAHAAYPSDRNYVQVAGKNGTHHSLHYVDVRPAGQSDVALMVHGNPSWSFYFHPIYNALSSEMRCVVPDHIGMGLSARPNDATYAYTLSSRIANLATLMEQIPGSVHLMVHDWGGAIGLGWALSSEATRSRIKSVSLFNTGAFLNPKGKRLPKELLLTRSWVGEHVVLGHNAFARGAARFCVTRNRLASDIHDAMLYPYRTRDLRLSTLRFVQDIPLSEKDVAYATIAELEGRLPLLKHVPVFIGWGAKDFVFDDAFLNRWKELVPHAEVHRVSDAGHYVVLDAWSELQTPHRAFLSRNR